MRLAQTFPAPAAVAAGLMAAAGAGAAPVVFDGNGHSYEVLLDDTRSWSEARAAARAGGRDLATVTSAEEQAFVESLLLASDAPTGSYWFGLRETATEGVFRPVNGEASDFTHFAPAEPNNGGEEAESVGGIYWTADADAPVRPATVPRRGFWNDLPEQGYSNDASIAVGQADLLRAGYVVEAAAPVAVPLPPAALAFPAAALAAGWAARRVRRW